MSLGALLGSTAVVGSIPLLWWSLASGRSSNPLVRRNLGAAPTPPALAREHAPRTTLSDLVARLPLSMTELESRVTRAGLTTRWPAERVMVLKVALALGVLVLGGLRAITAASPLWLAVTVGVAAGAFLLPDAQLAGKARQRQDEIQFQLPDLLDQLTVSIEAGLGFDSALARAVHTGEGPIYDEFARVLQDMRLGVPRETALEALGQRTSVADLRHFVSAVAQSGRYGLPLADVMRVQATEMRDRRRARAEERALQIPVKIVVPLVLCVLPALFVVLLGPAVIRISSQGGLFGR